MAPFGGFLSPFSPKYVLSLLKFRPEVVFHKTKTVSEQSPAYAPALSEVNITISNNNKIKTF